MRVRIICYEAIDGWILGKIASKLCENLIILGVEADVSNVPDKAADINYHIIYSSYDGLRSNMDTAMITHIDTAWKLSKVWQIIGNSEICICLSSDTLRKLVRFGVPRNKLAYINPAHDDAFMPRKTLIGLTTRIYPDGCKREWMLLDLAKRIQIDDFRFFIMGAGWEKIVGDVRRLGIEVEYFPTFDRETYEKMLPQLDFYLYFGQDEGSMGFIDALNAGVETIVTPQGFHLDAENGITHPFNTIEELVKVFKSISARKARSRNAVQSWSWPEYAHKHLEIWQYILNRRHPSSNTYRPRFSLRQLGIAKYQSLATLQTIFWRYLAKIASLMFRIMRGCGKLHGFCKKTRQLK